MNKNAKKTTKNDSTNTVLTEIDEKLNRMVSIKYTFLLGIVRGFGVAVGATIVAAIAFALLSTIIDTVDDVPILKDIIESSSIDDAVQEGNGNR